MNRSLIKSILFLMNVQLGDEEQPGNGSSFGLLPLFNNIAEDLNQTVQNLEHRRFSNMKGTLQRGTTSLNVCTYGVCYQYYHRCWIIWEKIIMESMYSVGNFESIMICSDRRIFGIIRK